MSSPPNPKTHARETITTTNATNSDINNNINTNINTPTLTSTPSLPHSKPTMPLTWAQVAQRAIQAKTDVAAQQTWLTLDLDTAFAGVSVWADEVEEEERREEGRGGEEVERREDEVKELREVERCGEGIYGGFDGHVDDAMERVEREQALFEGAGKRVAVGIPVVVERETEGGLTGVADEVLTSAGSKENEGIEDNGNEEQLLVDPDDAETKDATSAPTTPKKKKKRKSRAKSEDLSPLKAQDQEQKQEQSQRQDSLEINTNTSYRFSSVAEHENPVTAPYWRDSEQKADKGDDADEGDKSSEKAEPSGSKTAYRFSTAAEHEQPVTAPFWRINENNGEKDVGADESEEQGKEFTDEDDDGDEALSPRFKEYMDKHNDMMQHQTISSPHPHEILSAALRAQSIARDLLASEAAHNDLPLIMHAHACLVIGCSDSDDCYERMVEACGLFQTAIQEGVLEREKGREMLEVCRKVMGVMRKGEGGDGEREDESEGSGDDKDSEDGEEDGGEDGGEDYRLP